MGVSGAIVACSRPPAPAAIGLLETMRQLTTAQVLSKEAVEGALEADLNTDTNASHEMVTFYTGGPRPGSRFEKTVKLIDLRVPTAQNDVMRDPFLTIELRDDAGITAGDVEQVLGRPGDIDVPEPNPRTSASYIYTLGPHRLWISVGHDSARSIRGVSVHRNEKGGENSLQDSLELTRSPHRRFEIVGSGATRAACEASAQPAAGSRRPSFPLYSWRG